MLVLHTRNDEMKIFALNVLLIAIWLVQTSLALPQGSPAKPSGETDFFSQLGEYIVSLNLPEIPAGLAKIPGNQLMACVPANHKATVNENCLGNQPVIVAECILVKLLKVLDNVTGELNLTALKAISVGDSGLTAAQRTSASASLDACLASDMKLPTSPPDQDMEILIKESVKKYGEKNNPVRILFCLSKALIQNGCADANGGK